MKQSTSNVQRNTFSSIFLKFAICFLFLGLAYRLFSSSLVQFSPVFVANEDEPGLDIRNGKTVPPHDAAEPPPETTDDDLFVNFDDDLTSENGKCNLFEGDWIPDPNGPMYTNSTCHTIEDPQNCMKNGRPDFDYVYWRWKPRDCDLPQFDAKKFLNKMKHKSLAFIGDSILRNQVQSLLCMLAQAEQAVEVYHDETYKNRRWSFPSHDFTVSLVWSPFLTKADIFEDDDGVSTGIIHLHLDKPDTVWTEQFKNLDYVVIAGGKWFLKSALYYENNTLTGCHNCHDANITEMGFAYAYRKALHSILNFITDSKNKPFTLFRTSTPDHFENGEWNTGGYCNRTRPYKTGEIDINGTDETMRRAELEEFETAAAIASANGMSLKLFDMTFLSLLRPDGHPGVYRQFHPYAGKDKHAKIQNDCLHWCLPGPIDSWNDLLMAMLLED